MGMKADKAIELIARASKRELLRYNSLFKDTEANWGIAFIGTSTQSVSANVTKPLTIDISRFGFLSRSDFEIIAAVSGSNSQHATWGVDETQTTTSSLRIGVFCTQNTTLTFTYVIVAKGFGGGAGNGSGSNLPAGGTTNQALVKASDADYDFKYDDVLTTEALDNRTLTPSGWGVAKTGVVRINLPSEVGAHTNVDLTDLNFASVDDYNVAVIQCGGNAAWGKTKVHCAKESTTLLNIGAYKADSGSSFVDVSYIVVAKGYGGTHFADGTGLPVGGEDGQILTKIGNEDGVADWGFDTGADLVKFGRKYGIIPTQTEIKQRIGIYDGVYNDSGGRWYAVPIGGIITSESALKNGIYNNFDVYVTLSGDSERKVISHGVDRCSLDGTNWALYLGHTGTVGSNVRIGLYGTRDSGSVSESKAVTSIRFVARGNDNFGLSDGTAPYDIRNVTGMVLDDLKVTGNAVPTDWGIATVAKTSISIPSANSAVQTIDVSGFNFENGDDYIVSCNIYSGTGDWAKAIMNVGTKTATSFMLIVKSVGDNITRVDVEYAIFAKGYGNNMMQGGGSGTSLPSGGTTGQALVKKSDADGDVEWADINIPDGWGVAKSETISVPVTNTTGSFTINISDLGITSVNDYNVVFSVVGGTGSGAWGDSNVYAWGRNTSAINGSINTTSGDIQSILVSYVVVAKGFGGGGAGGVSFPKGGTTGQILAKASDNDGDAYWISNAGSDLVKYGRQYGVYAQSTPVTQLVATNAGKATSVSTRYEIPIVGCLTSIVNKATREENKEAFTNAITNAFDVYVEVENEGSERKLESRVQSADSTVRWVMNPQKFTHERVSYLFEQIQNNKISLLFSYRDDRLTSSSTRATVGSVRLVAKNGNNFGISTGTDPKYVRNLTGMVLDDLGIAGSNTPTSWGVAASGTAGVPIVNQAGQFAFSVSGLGITNPDDYNVAIEVIGGGTGNWGDSKHYIWEKSTDRFAGSITTTGSDVDRVDISYTIFAKGYGNLTQNSNSSIPAGYSPMQIEMVDSNGVTHTYEILGKEITP